MNRIIVVLLAFVAFVEVRGQSSDDLARKLGWTFKGTNTQVQISEEWRVDAVDVVFMSRDNRRGGVLQIGSLFWDAGNHYAPGKGVMAYGGSISSDTRKYPFDALFYVTSDDGTMPIQSRDGTWTYPPGFRTSQCGIFSGLRGNQGDGTYALATINLPQDFSSGQLSIPAGTYDGRYNHARNAGGGMFQMIGYKQYFDRANNIILAIEDGGDSDYNDIILRVRTNTPPVEGIRPDIAWTSVPSGPVMAGKEYEIRATATDNDSDVCQVNVWVAPGSGGSRPVGTPPVPSFGDFAEAGSGTTGKTLSAGTTTSSFVAGTYTYFAQALDKMSNASAIIVTTVTVKEEEVIKRTPPTASLSGTSGRISISASKKK